MRPLLLTLLWMVHLMSAAQTPNASPDLDRLRQQVYAAERAFARSMAERRHEDFVWHLSEQAVFVGGNRVLRGKAEVAAGWMPLYEGAKAPFSWEPDQVEVLADGTLAQSTGLVRDPEGRLTNRFVSIWRQESPGVWRVVFDRGAPLTDAEKSSAR